MWVTSEKGRLDVYRFWLRGKRYEVHEDARVYEITAAKPLVRVQGVMATRVLGAMARREGGGTLRTAWTWLVDAWHVATKGRPE